MRINYAISFLYIDELDYTVVKRILAAEGDTVNIDESGVYEKVIIPYVQRIMCRSIRNLHHLERECFFFQMKFCVFHLIRGF